MTPYAPGAYNAWIGNRFVIPPLGQYARPSYAEAVAPVVAADPALAAAMPQALGPRAMPADFGYQGNSYLSDPNIGMNAKSPSFGDFARAVTTGPVAGFGSVLGQAVLNDMAGRPAQAINSASLTSLLGSAADAAGFGAGQFSGPGGRSKDAPETLGGVSEADMAGASGGFGRDAYSPEAQAAAEMGGYEGSGMYAKGGKVDKLLGPNPPGPDDGFGALQRGEYVVRKTEAEKHRGLLEAINKGKLSKKKARGLLG